MSDPTAVATPDDSTARAAGESSEDEPPPATGLPVLRLEPVIEGGDWSGIEPVEPLVDGVARAIAGSALLADRLADPAQVCIAFASDAMVQSLNASYRGKDRPTNVLSFPAPRATPAAAGEARHLGDVVLAAATVVAEAESLGVPLSHHVRHLIVHGVLHLLGFDHESDEEAEIMEAEERRVLSSLGIADPYSDNL